MDDRGHLAQSLKPKVKQRQAAARLQPHAESWLGAGFGWRRRAHRWLQTICEFDVPRGLGSSAAALLLLASASYGAVKGGHVAELAARLEDFCDTAANAAG
ncbi:MAG: hypothetical protein ABI830_06920, partial [Pseudolabrys sp.]